jgi:hypothetical protein
MTYYTVYQITNLFNNKVYVGCHKTEDPYDEYLGSGKLLNQAVEKYGTKNFKKDVLYIFDNPDEMYKKEREIVNEQFILREDTYNIKLGGAGGWDHIDAAQLWQDPEYRKNSIANMKETRSKPEYLKNRSNITKSVFQNPEVRKRHSDSIKKFWNDPEQHKKQSKSMKNVWDNPELRKKQSDTHKKLCNDPKHLEKKSSVMKKKWQDPEYRKKQSMARSIANKGTMWIYSETDDIEKQINKHDLIPDGYRKGRRRKSLRTKQ